ncbi:PASTA domain-containing protein [Streptomyces ossamyceticus]|uniref:PASTA domain-containing protein n=1 Tax=Streptomyces ossamyceticus TaxID=249581 RepID=A0ABV2UUS8_9ACTN
MAGDGEVLKALLRRRHSMPADACTKGDPEGGHELAMSTGKKRWLGMSVLAVVLLLLLLRSCGEDCEERAVATPRATVTATVTATPSPIGSQVGEPVGTALKQVKQTGLGVGVHDASEKHRTPGGDWTVCFEKVTLSKVEFAAVPPGAPCPSKDGKHIPWPKMPDVKGITYGKAVRILAEDAGRVVLKAAYQDEDASDQDNGSGEYADWKICFQNVKAGRAFTYEPEIILHAVQKGEACPAVKGLYKDPTNDPDYIEPAPDPDYGSGSSDDDWSTTGGSGGDDNDYYPGDKGGCPPGGCYNPCPPGGCR